MLFPHRPELSQFLLPRDDESTVFAAALKMAVKMRREFYYRKRIDNEPEPTWIHQDRQLDPASEKTLYAQLREDVEELRHLVTRAKLLVGDRL